VRDIGDYLQCNRDITLAFGLDTNVFIGKIFIFIQCLCRDRCDCKISSVM